MYFILFVTVLITAVFLVMAAYVIAKLIGPRTYNKVKGEPFECGIPTHGSSWIPVHVGYYLFAILFLIFDVETVFLYPWAVVVKEFGAMAMVSIAFFLLVLVFGLAYAWRKGALKKKKKNRLSKTFLMKTLKTTTLLRKLFKSFTKAELMLL